MQTAAVILPNQLAASNPVSSRATDVFLFEHPRFFDAFCFHKKKLLFHRASMKAYTCALESKRHRIHYVDHVRFTDSGGLVGILREASPSERYVTDPCDTVLNQELDQAASLLGITAHVVDTALAHHIERLMVLGNFMLLCEIRPDEIYRWFMELFIDAYDWVMVPNVYVMSQSADGGPITTKPHISSSSYLRKMSDFRGCWCDIWDALFWRFILTHRSTFAANPRTRIVVRQLDRMDDHRRKTHVELAERYLTTFFAPLAAIRAAGPPIGPGCSQNSPST